MFKKMFRFFLAFTISMATFGGSHLASAEKAERSPQKVLVKLDQGTNDLHAVLMALKISEGLRK